MAASKISFLSLVLVCFVVAAHAQYYHDPCGQCSNYATCIRYSTSIKCKCKHGYNGDGYDCYKLSCDDSRCPPHSVCKYNILGGIRCVCKKGYYKNGRYCISNHSCEYRCGPYRRQYRCQCDRGCEYRYDCCKDYKQQCSRRFPYLPYQPYQPYRSRPFHG